MTQLGIEPKSPGPLAKIQTIMPISSTMENVKKYKGRESVKRQR